MYYFSRSGETWTKEASKFLSGVLYLSSVATDFQTGTFSFTPALVLDSKAPPAAHSA